MKAKHYVAFLAVLGSIFWFSMMTVSQIETLTTPHARFLFLISFLIPLFAGIIGLCFLLIEIPRKN